MLRCRRGMLAASPWMHHRVFRRSRLGGNPVALGGAMPRHCAPTAPGLPGARRFLCCAK